MRAYDFDSAFLQGDYYANPGEVVYMKLPSQLQTGPYGFSKNCIARCDKSLYGLKDAPAAWRAKARRILVEHGFRELVSESCVFILEKDKKRRGPLPAKVPTYQSYHEITSELVYDIPAPESVLALVGLHVDDAFCVACPEFYGDPELWPSISTVCSAGKPEIPARGDSCVYTGKEVKQDKITKEVSMSMDHYAKRMDKIEIPPRIAEQLAKGETVPFSERTKAGKCLFQSQVGALRWVNGMRPENSYPLSVASTSASKPTWSAVIHLNQCVDQLRENPELPLKFRKTHDTVICGISDASLANGERGSAQQGCILLAASKGDFASNKTRKNVRGSVLIAKSTIQRRKAQSSTGSELLALRATAALAEWANAIAVEIGLVKKGNVPHLVCDARDVIASAGGSKRPTEANLVADYWALRLKIRHNLLKIFHCSGSRNPADALTKEASKTNATRRLLAEGFRGGNWDLSSDAKRQPQGKT